MDIVCPRQETHSMSVHCKRQKCIPGSYMTQILHMVPQVLSPIPFKLPGHPKNPLDLSNTVE
jgi:hypothetical protein